MSIQKLVDKFGRNHDYLRISLTDACNLRCLYCMPNEKVLVTPSAKMMQKEEIFEIAKIFVDFGIKKIRLTGGEPLLRKDFTEIVQKLATLPIEITLSTNAVLVHKYISTFKKYGIKKINISLDTLDPDAFLLLTRRNEFEQIKKNIELLLENDFIVKINCVLLKNKNENAIMDFINWTKNAAIEVRFIEFMPFQGNSWQKEAVVAYQEVVSLIEKEHSLIRLKDEPNDTAKHYQIQGYKGTFAFISTITEPFCSSCNRLRLTSDGKMKNCLFSTGEMDLLTAYRAKQDIRQMIIDNVLAKKQERGGRFEVISENLDENRSMIKIGG